MWIVIRPDQTATYYDSFDSAINHARFFVDLLIHVDAYIEYLADKILEALK